MGSEVVHGAAPRRLVSSDECSLAIGQRQHDRLDHARPTRSSDVVEWKVEDGRWSEMCTFGDNRVVNAQWARPTSKSGKIDMRS